MRKTENTFQKRASSILTRGIAQYLKNTEIPGMARAVRLQIQINHIKIGKNLERAKIWISCFSLFDESTAKATSEESSLVIKKLNENAPAIKKSLSRNFPYQRFPELIFLFDEIPDEASKIQNILSQLEH